MIIFSIGLLIGGFVGLLFAGIIASGKNAEALTNQQHLQFSSASRAVKTGRAYAGLGT